MRFTTALPLLILISACGDDGGGGGGSADAPPSAPAMITISGEATKRSGLTETPAEGAIVTAYKNGSTTPVAMTTVDAAGMYSLTLETGGVALDGYLKATISGFLDLYLYPPKPLTADFSGASLNIVAQSTVDLLHQICKPNQDMTKAPIALIVADAANNPLAGATVTAQPAAANDCYNGGNGLPDAAINVTAADGIAYLINVPAGEVTVSASLGGTTFGSHKVNARAGTFTTTVVQQ